MLVLVPGCGMKGCSNDTSSGLTYQSYTELPAPTLGNATVRGTVSFEGTVPAPKQIHKPTGACPHPVFDERLIVGEGGGLRNAVVFLEGVPASSGADKPQVTLDQLNCQFVPHVLAVQVGQPVEIKNSDPTTHNVHYLPKRNDDMNHDFSGSSMARSEIVRFEKAEPEPFETKCDVHAWMRSYVAVFDHPFFAVTDETGAFELANVPAGTYTLKTWHELHHEQERQITVGDGEELVEDFTYRRDG